MRELLDAMGVKVIDKTIWNICCRVVSTISSSFVEWLTLFRAFIFFHASH
jgi:hypothetical protein